MVQIEKFQEKAYMEFQDYVTKAYPDDTYRSVKLHAYLIDSFFRAPVILICMVFLVINIYIFFLPP